MYSLDLSHPLAKLSITSACKRNCGMDQAPTSNHCPCLLMYLSLKTIIFI